MARTRVVNRSINVWIAPLMDKRKHCHHCQAEITEQNVHISVGEYVRCTFRSAFYGCGECIYDETAHRLHRFAGWQFCVRSGHKMPWIRTMNNG